MRAELWSYGIKPVLIVAGAILLLPGADVLQQFEVVQATVAEEAATAWAGFEFRERAE